MMSRFTKIVLSIAIIATAIVESGCTRDEGLGIKKNEGQRLRFHITMAQEQIVNSRGTDSEGVTNDIYVMVLNGSGDDATVIDWAEATSTGESIYYASLKTSTTEGFVCVAANISRSVALQGEITWIGLTLREVKDKLKVQLRKSNNYIVEDPIFSPMVSDIRDYSAPNAIKDASSISFDLKRSTAKVTVKNNSNNRNFILLGSNIGNAPGYGYLFENGTPISADDCANYAGLLSGTTYSPEVMMRGIDKIARTQTEPLYLFESPASNATFVIIKCKYDGVEGYHRINLWDPTTKEHLPITRNTQYQVNINKVSSAGYSSAREAINDADPMNSDIEVDIDVTDGVSKDIVSNGEYYLGVSNTRFVVYSDSELTQYLITDVANNAPSGITGTLAVKTIEGEGTISVTSNPFKAGNGNVQTGELRITLPANLLQGEITLRVGNLSKRISIERRKEAISMGGNIPLLKTYAYGKVKGETDQWLRLTTEGTSTFDDAVAEYVNTGTENQGLYMALMNNVIYDVEESKTRSSEMILFNAEDEGHTKVAVIQTPFEIFGKPEVSLAKILNPYVGAFWRNNQSGERVIKMKIEGTPAQLSWDAQVAVGHDWIRLQSGGSSDTHIYTTDAMLGDDASFERTHQLTDISKTAIHGTSEQVLFRIGLVGTKDYPTGYIGKTEHRYGLVVVSTYIDGELYNVYRLFVRQGDAADYLFRDVDGGYDGWSEPRVLATKISAYNLTDPALGKGSITGTPGTLELEGNIPKHNRMPLDYYPETINTTFNAAKFTKFPSQAGYLFVWNLKTRDVDEISLGRNLNFARAFHPVNNKNLQHLITGGDRESLSSGIPYNEYPLFYNKDADPCPYGYRYPQLGKQEANKVTTTLASESELIQSLLYDPLAPKRGSNPAIMGKYTAWGYYADGFFDRLNINDKKYGSIPVASYVLKTEQITEATGNDIAYTGMVIFNPFNLSSIFFPATGYIDPVSSNKTTPMISPGRSTNIWASERDDSRTANTVCYPFDLTGFRGGFNITSQQGVSPHARTVRCVRDEKTWPDNGE